MESVWLLLGSGRDAGPADPFWVFLTPGHFAAKTPADECWIVLDFLGFSRQLQDETQEIDNAPISATVPSPKNAVRE